MALRLQGGSFLRAVLDHVERRPEMRACVLIREDGERDVLSRAALHAGALAWAEALRARAIGSGDLVLIALDHSRALVESILGTWYAGAVPAVTRYPSPDGAASGPRRVARVRRARMVAVRSGRLPAPIHVPAVLIVPPAIPSRDECAHGAAVCPI
jgi:acyl-CoA synthetase (AMP-forming)/AMP-acid ligase II